MFRKETKMTRLKILAALCIVPVLVATLMATPVMAQNPTGQEPKAPEGKTVEGTLVDIDQTTSVLTLKTGDTETKFSFTDQTELVAPDNGGNPPVVTKGTRMRVYYTEHEKTNVATKIEIIEAAAAR
jgi:hypothetical protein